MKNKNRAHSGIDLKKYEDQGGTTLRQMHFGLWLSSNRRRLVKLIIIFLIAISAATVFYSTYNYVVYFLYGRAEDRAVAESIASSLLDIQGYREANAPSPLSVGEVSIFSVGDRYDFLVPVYNPNPKHFSNFNYCLQTSQEVDVVCGSNFILPGARKYLIIAGQKLDQTPTSLKFKATNFAWQRLNAHDVPDWEAYVAQRLNVMISEVKYSAPDNTAKNPFHSLSFKVQNNNPYHYARLPLDIILLNGEQVSGVNVYNLDNFLSTETREVRLSWPSGKERVTRVEILPDVNILDSSVYLPYRGETVK